MFQLLNGNANPLVRGGYHVLAVYRDSVWCATHLRADCQSLLGLRLAAICAAPRLQFRARIGKMSQAKLVQFLFQAALVGIAVAVGSYAWQANAYGWSGTQLCLLSAACVIVATGLHWCDNRRQQPLSLALRALDSTVLGLVVAPPVVLLLGQQRKDLDAATVVTMIEFVPPLVILKLVLWWGVKRTGGIPNQPLK